MALCRRRTHEIHAGNSCAAEAAPGTLLLTHSRSFPATAPGLSAAALQQSWKLLPLTAVLLGSPAKQQSGPSVPTRQLFRLLGDKTRLAS